MCLVAQTHNPTRNGTVVLFDVFGHEIKTLSLDRPEIKEHGILDAFVWSNGIVCLTNNFKLFCMMNFNDPYIIKLADVNITEPPSCWTVLEPHVADNNTIQVILVTSFGSVFIVNVNSFRDTTVKILSACEVCASPSGKILAFYTTEGDVKVYSIDFKTHITTFSTKNSIRPTQFVWCGGDAVVCLWDKKTHHELLIIGPNSNFIKYEYEEPVVLVSESDGLRIVSERKCEFLQKVPESTESIFRLDSKTPASVLYRAYEAFEKRDPKSDELLRDIHDDLVNAVNITIEAASHEFDTTRQQKLLKAASLGKTFLESYNPDYFVEVCKTLRILNQIRDFRFGIPITFMQYKSLKTNLLIERLLNRNHHALANSICEYLNVKTDAVLIHWACCKVRARAKELHDEDSVRGFVSQIVGKLSSNQGISFAEIASAAYREKQLKLATLLLDHEPRAQDQVPLLISMKQDERALDKANDSGDSDLIHLVILHIRRTHPFKDFISIISKHDVSLSSYLKYCKENDLDQLKMVYEYHNRPDLLAFVEVKEALASRDFNEYKAHLSRAREMYSRNPNSVIAAKATEDEIGLTLKQKDLEMKLGIPLTGLSLSSTVYELIIRGDMKSAEKLAKTFKVPDKRLAWIKVRALASSGNWDELEKLSRERLPIGFQPFADMCLQANNNHEAVRYILKIKDPHMRTKYFIKAESWIEALNSAIESKDPEMLYLVEKNCKDPSIKAHLESRMQKR